MGTSILRRLENSRLQAEPARRRNTSMTPEQLNKIEEAARCLSRCDHSNVPFLTASQFLGQLKADPTWTDAEIIEMQTHRTSRENSSFFMRPSKNHRRIR
jgi:hypothetical protein